MKTTLYDYNGGLTLIPKDIAESVIIIITALNYSLGKYDIKHFKDDLSDSIKLYGWSGKVALSTRSNISITSMKKDVGLCIQTGNMARMYADLMKLQAMFLDGKIRAAIFVLPMRDCAVSIGSNIANYERFVNELTHVFSRVITVPMLIIGFDNVEG